MLCLSLIRGAYQSYLIWQELKDYSTDCYFTRNKVTYSSLESATWAISIQLKKIKVFLNQNLWTVLLLHFLSQEDLNVLVCDIHLSKRKTASRLKHWNLLQKDIMIVKRNLNNCFLNRRTQFSVTMSHLCWSQWVWSIRQKIGICSQTVLLDNGNKYPSIPIAHAAGMST